MINTEECVLEELLHELNATAEQAIQLSKKDREDP